MSSHLNETFINKSPRLELHQSVKIHAHFFFFIHFARVYFARVYSML